MVNSLVPNWSGIRNPEKISEGKSFKWFIGRTVYQPRSNRHRVFSYHPDWLHQPSHLWSRMLWSINHTLTSTHIYTHALRLSGDWKFSCSVVSMCFVHFCSVRVCTSERDRRIESVIQIISSTTKRISTSVWNIVCMKIFYFRIFDPPYIKHNRKSQFITHTMRKNRCIPFTLAPRAISFSICDEKSDDRMKMCEREKSVERARFSTCWFLYSSADLFLFLFLSQ